MEKPGKQGPLKPCPSSIASVHSDWKNFLLSQLLNILNITLEVHIIITM